MKKQSQIDAERYRKLLRQHEANPSDGISDEELQWLLDYQDQHLNDPVVRTEGEKDEEFTAFMLSALHREGSDALGLAGEASGEKEILIDSSLAKSTAGQGASPTAPANTRLFGPMIALMSVLYTAYLRRARFYTTVCLMMITGIVIIPEILYGLRPKGPASAYENLANLESGSVTRNTATQVIVESPDPGAEYNIHQLNTPVEIHVAGVLQTKQPSGYDSLEIKIFSNLLQEYINDLPRYRASLDPQVKDQAAFFAKTIRQPLPPGRYYLVIDGRYNRYYAETFYVNKREKRWWQL